MAAESYRIERYRRSRFFALYDATGELIAVTTYKKGAKAVKDRLEAQDRKIEELQARFNVLAAAQAVPSLIESLPAPSRNGGPHLPEDKEFLWSPP